ncbi:hypothetical protein L1887_23013 [Cichorium endivia]|nr:hypothetical protein L1887_23013 [Cichorium endivia]
MGVGIRSRAVLARYKIRGEMVTCWIGWTQQHARTRLVERWIGTRTTRKKLIVKKSLNNRIPLLFPHFLSPGVLHRRDGGTVNNPSSPML